jgi:O-antigen/teichoic acid export membrane protein
MFGTLAGISTTLGNFLSSLIVARLLGVDQAGTVAFAIWIVGLGTTMIGVGLPFTLARYMPELTARTDAEQAHGLAASLFRPFLAIAMLPTIAFCAYAVWLAFANPVAAANAGRTLQPLADPVICLLIGLNCTTLALADYARSYLRGLHAFGRVAQLTTTSGLGQIVALCVGSAVFGVRGAVAAYLIASLLPILVLTDLRGHRASPPKELTHRIARYARFRWASELLGFFVWSRMELFFLQIAWGVQAVGLFTVGLTLSNLAVQGPLMLTWALLPHFSEQHGRQDIASMRRVYATGTRLLAFLVFPACFGLAAVLPTLVPLLYGSAFAGSIPSAQVLVCAASISAVSAVGTNLVWALERSDIDFYAGVVGATLAVIGGLLLIGPFGELGAAFSRSVTQLAAVSVSSWFLTSRLGFAIPFRALLRLLASALLCGAAAHLCLMLIGGIAGLTLAIIIGAVVYFTAVRTLVALPKEDLERLRTALRATPWPIAQTAGPLASLILG